MIQPPPNRYVVAICGASGAIYGVRAVQTLLAMPLEIHLMVSKAGLQVLAHETRYAGEPIPDFFDGQGTARHPEARLAVYEADNLFAPSASGSFQHGGMAIIPCSMKTLAAVAAGAADDLIVRSADVCLKEKRPLVLVTRETPLNLIHIENMRKAALAGAVIMPPCPGFYGRPETLMDIVDGTVARVLDQLHIPHTLIKRWGDADRV